MLGMTLSDEASRRRQRRHLYSVTCIFTYMRKGGERAVKLDRCWLPCTKDHRHVPYSSPYCKLIAAKQACKQQTAPVDTMWFQVFLAVVLTFPHWHNCLQKQIVLQDLLITACSSCELCTPHCWQSLEYLQR